jgi:hypothetical protein
MEIINNIKITKYKNNQIKTLKIYYFLLLRHNT